MYSTVTALAVGSCTHASTSRQLQAHRHLCDNPKHTHFWQGLACELAGQSLGALASPWMARTHFWLWAAAAA